MNNGSWFYIDEGNKVIMIILPTEVVLMLMIESRHYNYRFIIDLLAIYRISTMILIILAEKIKELGQ